MIKFKLILFVIFILNVNSIHSELSEKRLCANENCTEPISLAKTIRGFPSIEKGMLSFPPNADVKVYSKPAGSNMGLWGVEINGKRGYVNKMYIREIKILKKFNELQHTVNTEVVSNEVPSKNTDGVESNAEPVVPDKVQEPYVVDGTTIFFSPQDDIAPSVTESSVQPTPVTQFNGERSEPVGDSQESDLLNPSNKQIEPQSASDEKTEPLSPSDTQFESATNKEAESSRTKAEETDIGAEQQAEEDESGKRTDTDPGGSTQSDGTKESGLSMERIKSDLKLLADSVLSSFSNTVSGDEDESGDTDEEGDNDEEDDDNEATIDEELDEQDESAEHTVSYGVYGQNLNADEEKGLDLEPFYNETEGELNSGVKDEMATGSLPEKKDDRNANVSIANELLNEAHEDNSIEENETTKNASDDSAEVDATALKTESLNEAQEVSSKTIEENEETTKNAGDDSIKVDADTLKAESLNVAHDVNGKAIEENEETTKNGDNSIKDESTVKTRNLLSETAESEEVVDKSTYPIDTTVKVPTDSTSLDENVADSTKDESILKIQNLLRETPESEEAVDESINPKILTDSSSIDENSSSEAKLDQNIPPDEGGEKLANVAESEKPAMDDELERGFLENQAESATTEIPSLSSTEFSPYEVPLPYDSNFEDVTPDPMATIEEENRDKNSSNDVNTDGNQVSENDTDTEGKIASEDKLGTEKLKDVDNEENNEEDGNLLPDGENVASDKKEESKLSEEVEEIIRKELNEIEDQKAKENDYSIFSGIASSLFGRTAKKEDAGVDDKETIEVRSDVEQKENFNEEEAVPDINNDSSVDNSSDENRDRNALPSAGLDSERAHEDLMHTHVLLSKDATDYESCPAGQTECPREISNVEKELTMEEVSDSLNLDFTNIVNLLTVLGVTGLSVVIFLLGYIMIDKSRREGPLIAKINNLEQALLISTQENQLLENKITDEKTIQQEETDRISSDAYENLRLELEQTLNAKAALEEQVQGLEKELENSTDVGLDLNRMLSEILSSQNGSDTLIANVEQLQRQLVEQQGTINSINATLNLKDTENHELQLELEINNKKVTDLQTELDRMVENLLKIEEEKEQVQNRLELEVSSLKEQLEKVTSADGRERKKLLNEIKAVTAKCAELQRSLELKSNEYVVLTDSVNQVKAVKNNTETLKSLLDLSSLKAELQQLQTDNQVLTNLLQQEQQTKYAFEKQTEVAIQEAQRLKTKYEDADREKLEAQTKLEVLSSYFKDKEAHLQKELSKQESMWTEKQGEATSTVERIKYMQEELQNCKAQNESLKQEIVSQEVELKSQISVLEKKAHESWVAARQAERKYDDARQEAAQLRNRLTLKERTVDEKLQNRLQSPLEQNGEIPSPLHLPVDSPASPPLIFGARDHLTTSPPIPGLPPFLPPPPGVPFMPPPMPGGVPFMPPPPALFPVDHRPPPLGRMSSPPINSRYSPDSRYSPYDRRSPSPPYDDDYGSSPPPPMHRGYSPYNDRDDRRDYKRLPPPPLRSNGRNKGAMSSGSANSNESLEKINRHHSKV